MNIILGVVTIVVLNVSLFTVILGAIHFLHKYQDSRKPGVKVK